MITTLPNGRSQRGITFHSLRHRFVSWLSEIGVPKDIRMLMAGHSSDSAHDGYDHTTIADVLPRLFNTISQFKATK
jgi:integrase